MHTVGTDRPSVTVVAVVSNTLPVALVVVMSPPLTARSPATVTVPPEAPTLIAVAAPPTLSVVALALNTVAVPVLVVVMSPPLTARSPLSVVLPVTPSVVPTVALPPTVAFPVIAVVALRIVAVPVVAPMLTVVAA